MRKVQPYILLIISCLMLNILWGNEPPGRDSLLAIWQNENNTDIDRLEALSTLINTHYINKKPDSTQLLAQQLYDKALETDNLFFQASALQYLGDAAMNKGLHQEAVPYLEEAFKLWQQLEHPKELALAYGSLGTYYNAIGKEEQALKHIEEGISICYEIGDSISAVRPLLNMATIFEAQEDILKSLEYNQKALNIAKRYNLQENTPIALNNIANNYKFLGDIENAASHYLQAKAINEATNNPWGLTSNLNNLALLYIDQKDFVKAKGYLDEALAIAKREKITQYEAMVYANFGEYYAKQGQFLESLAEFQQSRQIITENGIILMQPYIQLMLGDVYLELGDLTKAESFLEKGFASSKEHGRTIDVLDAHFYMSQLRIRQGRWEEAKAVASQGYQLGKQYERLLTTKKFAGQLVKINKHFGNSAEALRMFEEEVRLKDSLFNEENSRSLLRQEYEYAYEKKAYQDSIANVAIMELQAADLKRRRQTNRFLWGLLAMALVFAGILFSRNRLIQQQKERIEEENNRAETAIAKLMEIDQSKSRFFTNISHEFRTPLTVISGMLDQIQEHGKVKKLIRRNTNHLLQLINQILDLRKLESGSLPTHFIQADVVKYLKYITESFQSLARDKQLALNFNSTKEKLILDYDHEKLLRILSNLIANAIKFTPAGGEVTITVELDDESDPDSYRLIVADTGVGVPEKKLPYLFDRFYQVDSSTTRPGEGTGIGLTLIKELVLLMKGTISVKSKEGKGSTFIVELPLTNQAVLESVVPDTETVASVLPERSTDSSMAASKLSDAGLPRLLLVEDNPDVMEYLITCLEEDYQLVFAVDGQEGIEKALEEVPDIIISDVMMPRKDGFELCHTLKTDERTSHIPVILLTAKADVDSRITGLQRGADAYLAKPFDKRELESQLANLLLLRKRLQERYTNVEALEPTEDVVIQQEDAFILKIKEVFEERMDDPEFDLNALSKALLLSRSQLGRKVKALTGKSPALFIRSLRLSKAKQLILNSHLSFKEIAYDVGFTDPDYFSKSYFKEFGERPSTTRESSLLRK